MSGRRYPNTVFGSSKTKGKVMLRTSKRERAGFARPSSPRIPRQNEPGPYYGHPSVFIEPRGVPLGRSWAVCAADGGAWDRHTVKSWAESEQEAAAFAADLIGDPNFHPIPV
jgi:hypothetical protein